MGAETDKVAGRVKQAAGDLTNNEDLENEGDRQEMAGKVKDFVDDTADKVGDAIDNIKDKFKN